MRRLIETAAPALIGCGTTQAFALTSGLPVTVDNSQKRYVVGYRQGTQYKVDTFRTD